MTAVIESLHIWTIFQPTWLFHNLNEWNEIRKTSDKTPEIDDIKSSGIILIASRITEIKEEKMNLMSFA